ncbi:DUF3306 domain-containing protein [Maliponia aquimaris]|uniref:DUF3306 domain-containing protein n=1 Tax=Maliponia aquimaris TaxID=1673631 RepID=A0A238L830_9RHOB|nr:DUF3306 domain-containing protein [Maliponia aquimaris]SMX50532.1 hypothetical protein MAA8898_04836 [Maliponia aquimaris]
MTRDSSSDFWSRRRAGVAAETEAERHAREAAEKRAEEKRLEERTDEEILAELNLPAPEEIQDSAQVQALLRSVIPQRLRTRALRRLWRLNPIFSHLDGLVDYGNDYTDKATVLPNMKTIYKVGKGMFDKAVEAAEQAERDAAKAAEDAARAAEPEVPDQVRDAQALAEAADPALQAAQETPVPAPAPGPPTANTDAEDTPPAPSTSRRMRFRFDAAS